MSTAAPPDSFTRIAQPVQLPGSWLTWVSATTACLNALGVDWHDARRLASKFIQRVEQRSQPPCRHALHRATEALQMSASAMETVSQTFPFPGRRDQLTESAKRTATGALRQARQADRDALEALEQAVESWPHP